MILLLYIKSEISFTSIQLTLPDVREKKTANKFDTRRYHKL